MQHNPLKMTSHRCLSKLTIAIAIAIGVNTALLAMSRNGVAPLSNEIAAEPIDYLPKPNH